MNNDTLTKQNTRLKTAKQKLSVTNKKLIQEAETNSLALKEINDVLTKKDSIILGLTYDNHDLKENDHSEELFLEISELKNDIEAKEEMIIELRSFVEELQQELTEQSNQNGAVLKQVQSLLQA